MLKKTVDIPAPTAKAIKISFNLTSYGWRGGLNILAGFGHNLPSRFVFFGHQCPVAHWIDAHGLPRSFEHGEVYLKRISKPRMLVPAMVAPPVLAMICQESLLNRASISPRSPCISPRKSDFISSMSWRMPASIFSMS